MELNAKISENIRYLRTKEGLTQAELARKLNVSSGVIEKWENGRTAIKSDSVVQIADFFNISCDELLTGRKPQNVILANDLNLSDSSIDELRMNTPISSIINLLLSPNYCFDDIPIGHMILLLLSDSIFNDANIAEYSVGFSSDGKELKSFVHSSQINMIHINDLVSALRRLVKNGKKSKR